MVGGKGNSNLFVVHEHMTLCLTHTMKRGADTQHLVRNLTSTVSKGFLKRGKRRKKGRDVSHFLVANTVRQPYSENVSTNETQNLAIQLLIHDMTHVLPHTLPPTLSPTPKSLL